MENMNIKSIIATISILMVVAVSASLMFAQPKLSKEKKDFYDTKRLEHNSENDAIGKEKLKIVNMPEGTKKEQKLKELEQREIQHKKDSTQTAEKMNQDGYVNDEDIVDNNIKLIKHLEGLYNMTTWDIKHAPDKELENYDTQQLNKIKTLLDKVKMSDESNFAGLYTEYNNMIKGFQEDRPKFEKEYKEKHNK